MEQFTKTNAALIEKTFQNFLPSAVIKVNSSKATEPSAPVESVTANIQGPLRGNVLTDILDVVKIAKREYSIYRSGTGLTIKFI